MKRAVRLTLKKETLAALTGDDLAAVAGGAPLSGPTCVNCPTDRSCLPCVIAYSYYPPTMCEGEFTVRNVC